MLKTNKILNISDDSELKHLIKINTNSLRMQYQQKLSPKPSELTKSKASKSTYRNCAYKYNTLPSDITKITKYATFKTKLRLHLGS